MVKKIFMIVIILLSSIVLANYWGISVGVATENQESLDKKAGQSQDQQQKFDTQKPSGWYHHQDSNMDFAFGGILSTTSNHGGEIGQAFSVAANIKDGDAASWQEESDMRRNMVEEEIWALEEAYFTNLYKANYEGVLAIVHSQFLGWPGAAPQPLDKETSAHFMKQLAPEPTSCTLKIERAGIRVLGEVALTQYIILVTFTDSTDGVKTQSSRITHTWVKEDSHWKLLGGMSNDQ